MVYLRNFKDTDAEEFRLKQNSGMSSDEIRALFAAWNRKEYSGKYFEMFAVIRDGEIVGTISLYQHSQSVISFGPEVFEPYRRQGIGREAMILAMETAKEKGYRIVSQQIRVDNTASISLHSRLGFETDGYVYMNRKGNEVLIYLRVL